MRHALALTAALLAHGVTGCETKNVEKLDTDVAIKTAIQDRETKTAESIEGVLDPDQIPAQKIPQPVEVAEAPKREYLEDGSERLIAEIRSLLELQRAENQAKNDLILASAAVRDAKKRIAELSLLSHPEYSEEDVAAVREILVQEKNHFCISAMFAADAGKNYALWPVDEHYPQITLSEDQRILTYTIVLHAEHGNAIKVPHDIRVSIDLSKEGVIAGSVKIDNSHPENDKIAPTKFEKDMADVFGYQFSDREAEE